MTGKQLASNGSGAPRARRASQWWERWNPPTDGIGPKGCQKTSPGADQLAKRIASLKLALQRTIQSASSIPHALKVRLIVGIVASPTPIVPMSEDSTSVTRHPCD